MIQLHPRRIRHIKARAWDLAALLYTFAMILATVVLGIVALAM